MSSSSQEISFASRRRRIRDTHKLCDSMLLRVGGRVIWGIDGEDGAYCLAFFCRKVAGEPGRVDDLLALVWRHLAEICDGMNHHASARDGRSM